MLIPILTLIIAAGVSRSARATNGSSIALPENPRLTSSTPAVRAASAGQVVLGPAALLPWLIELPWCSHTGRPPGGTTATGASVRSATTSVISLCGSQISTSVSWPGRVNRTGPGAPSVTVTCPVAGSVMRSFPPEVVALPIGRPSTSRS